MMPLPGSNPVDAVQRAVDLLDERAASAADASC
jgi:hypothetical protein